MTMIEAQIQADTDRQTNGRMDTGQRARHCLPRNTTTQAQLQAEQNRETDWQIQTNRRMDREPETLYLEMAILSTRRLPWRCYRRRCRLKLTRCKRRENRRRCRGRIHRRVAKRKWRVPWSWRDRRAKTEADSRLTQKQSYVTYNSNFEPNGLADSKRAKNCVRSKRKGDKKDIYVNFTGLYIIEFPPPLRFWGGEKHRVWWWGRKS